MARLLRASLLILLLLASPFPLAVANTPDAAEGTHCWPGSIYRRVVTHAGFNRIDITVTLPDVVMDPTRQEDPFRQLDGFHIYIGGTSLSEATQVPGQSSEIDAGLAWEIGRNKWGEIDVFNFHRAWHPFLRTSSPTKYVLAPTVADYYWHPGDEVTLSFEVVAPEMVTLTVTGAGKSYTFPPVKANGFDLDGNQLLKWVTSLDQSGLEGRGNVPTSARVEGIHIQNVTLWTPDGESVSLTEALVHKPRTCIWPREGYFTIEHRMKYVDEIITIQGFQAD